MKRDNEVDTWVRDILSSFRQLLEEFRVANVWWYTRYCGISIQGASISIPSTTYFFPPVVHPPHFKPLLLRRALN